MLSLYDNIYVDGKGAMKIVLRIKEAAKDRGVTLSGIAGKLGIHRSNMSAIASGSRGVSLKMLAKISRILDCGTGELVGQKTHPPIFKGRGLECALSNIEKANYDGIDKSWVNRLMFAQKMHYKNIKRTTR